MEHLIAELAGTFGLSTHPVSTMKMSTHLYNLSSLDKFIQKKAAKFIHVLRWKLSLVVFYHLLTAQNAT